jgi:hypothetical protein
MVHQSKDDYEEAVVKRLNLVITLLTDLVKGEQSTRDKIKMLNDAGLDYKDIASILNKDKNHVAVELNNLKKKKTKEGGELS